MARLYEFRVRRVSRAMEPVGSDHATRPAEVAQIARFMLKDDPREHMFAIHLDVRNRVIGVEVVAIGSATGVDVHPRELFRAAILSGASAVVLAHNHPSGDAQPSQSDIALTHRMYKCGELLGIPVLDHVVVAEREHYSIAEECGRLMDLPG